MAKKSIFWSAAANKKWVTLEPTAGFGDSNMKVIVQPAESQGDDLEATITIKYGNGNVVKRTVSRCERKPISTEYSLSSAPYKRDEFLLNVLDIRPYRLHTSYFLRTLHSAYSNILV